MADGFAVIQSTTAAGNGESPIRLRIFGSGPSAPNAPHRQHRPWRSASRGVATERPGARGKCRASLAANCRRLPRRAVAANQTERACRHGLARAKDVNRSVTDSITILPMCFESSGRLVRGFPAVCESVFATSVSAMVQERTLTSAHAMSALPAKPDITKHAPLSLFTNAGEPSRLRREHLFVTMKYGHPARGRGRPSQPCLKDSHHTSR